MNDLADLHYHPTLQVAVTCDRVYRLDDEGALVPVTVSYSGKLDRPYPGCNVRRDDGPWCYRMLSRLMREAHEGREFPKEIHMHHGTGREKGDFRFGSTSPLDQVTHGRESRARQIAMQRQREVTT